MRYLLAAGHPLPTPTPFASDLSPPALAIYIQAGTYDIVCSSFSCLTEDGRDPGEGLSLIFTPLTTGIVPPHSPPSPNSATVPLVSPPPPPMVSLSSSHSSSSQAPPFQVALEQSR